ncbi:MAG: hypothetical protein ACOZQL_01415 [Myxococcota bacterium]
MKTLLVLLLAALPALADILPDEVASCQGKSAGAACTTPEGEPGTCQSITITRPDYSSGIPPKSKQVQMLGCVATAKGTARSLLPWVGTGLAFLALLLAMLLRGRRPALA